MTNRTEPAAQPGRMALVGSGEYLPAMHDTEAWLLENRPPRYVQLATAAAPEGQRVLDTWHRLGAEAADRLGVEPVILDVRVRQDAFDPEHIRQVANAGLIYLSGGNPRHLASTLIDTPLWDAILEAWRAGASLAGCSAGAMALCGYVPNVRHPRQGGQSGLGVLPTLRVLPHFDVYGKWIPDIVMRPLLTDDTIVIGIDEQTALRGEPSDSDDQAWQFTSVGRGSCWRIGHDRKHRINSPVHLPISATISPGSNSRV